MEKTEKMNVLTMEMKKEQKASVTELFEEVVEVITDSFVAIYEREDTALIMQISNGQKYKITVQETV